ncbi:unnamed protein product [Prorocentrum cordatum]|uniref:Secreted protein n=1 Tax=Prorocentrum cordatum TaxID=2364126 RepID=A0ABN9UWR2_9DINO|nr:unnamed protein product [Polarella glacialis]
MCAIQFVVPTVVVYVAALEGQRLWGRQRADSLILLAGPPAPRPARISTTVAATPAKIEDRGLQDQNSAHKNCRRLDPPGSARGRSAATHQGAGAHELLPAVPHGLRPVLSAPRKTNQHKACTSGGPRAMLRSALGPPGWRL